MGLVSIVVAAIALPGPGQARAQAGSPATQGRGDKGEKKVGRDGHAARARADRCPSSALPAGGRARPPRIGAATSGEASSERAVDQPGVSLAGAINPTADAVSGASAMRRVRAGRAGRDGAAATGPARVARPEARRTTRAPAHPRARAARGGHGPATPQSVARCGPSAAAR
ncbi:MAG TPA: hypothetical protein VKB80_27185 [Kofleriaceae bacterium]|nr:hypothetical protein [Kofleriaceae bacterium]